MIPTHRPRENRTPPPRHRTPGRDQGRARRGRRTRPRRKNKQTYMILLLPTRAAEARKAGSKPPAGREAHAEQKRTPGQNKKHTQDAPPEGPAGRDTQDAPRRVNQYYIFLFFSFSLGEFSDPVRKSRTVSHRHKLTKLSEAPETLCLWAFSAVSTV